MLWDPTATASNLAEPNLGERAKELQQGGFGR